jgi:hypothetical protein
MRTFIVTKAQLMEYIDNKRTEMVFYDIVADLHETNKFLNESISKDKVNQSVIDNYNRKNLLTPEVNEMLIKYGVVNEKREII